MRHCPDCHADQAIKNGSNATGKRQRMSRLVRKTLSFSTKRENHIGAIWYIVHHDNASLA